jgi:hypothetical protein
MNSKNVDRTAKAAEAILLLIVGQLGIGIMSFVLFSVSFIASPLRPLVWAQFAAAAVFILGELLLIVIVVARYKSELLAVFRSSPPSANSAEHR